MSPEALRVPPHSIEAEQSVIGALLLDNRVFDKLGELRADEFYNAGHQYIFEAMHAAWVAGQTFDAVTVSEALKASGKLEHVGGLAYIGALQNAVPSSANAARYALIVRERAKLRGLAAVGAEVSELGFKADIGADEAIAVFDAHIDRIREQGPDPAAVERSKARLLTGFYSGLRTAAGKATSLGEYETTVGDYTELFSLPEALRSATADELREVARRYLAKTQRTIIIAEPDGSAGSEGGSDDGDEVHDD